MRAARLLQILLLLQNRGRLSSAELAEELEVARRTIFRDVDAMTEAGLPIIVHRGNAGGIELGFNYRTRLTGLASEEAEALAVILSRPMPELADLGMQKAADQARAKLIESLPDGVREKVQRAQLFFRFEPAADKSPDPRIEALAKAVRDGRIVRIRAKSSDARIIHPDALVIGRQGWSVVDRQNPDAPIPMAEWGDLNISARRFADG
ncbi:MAG: HTH domain-containing protein [Pseudomonadota bacterium]